MCPAAARIENKYSIPRNPIIPEPSVLDILLSGPLFKSREGKGEGYAMPLFRAGSEATSGFSMDKQGVLYPFKHGQIYIYDEARTAASLMFESAAVAASFVLPGLGELAGGLSKLVEIGGEMLLETVNDKMREGTAHSQATFGDQVKMLETRGMVVLPGVNVVDLEHQVEPGGFLSKEAHRLTYTYEERHGQQTRYQTGAPMKGDKANVVNMGVTVALTARMWGEIDYLFQLIKDEYAPGFDAIRSDMHTSFEQQHGDGTANGSLEFAKEVNDRYRIEVERNGFTSALGGQRALELLEPMREDYDKTPVLRDMMQNLRALAAGQTA